MVIIAVAVTATRVLSLSSLFGGREAPFYPALRRNVAEIRSVFVERRSRRGRRENDARGRTAIRGERSARRVSALRPTRGHPSIPVFANALCHPPADSNLTRWGVTQLSPSSIILALDRKRFFYKYNTIYRVSVSEMTSYRNEHRPLLPQCSHGYISLVLCNKIVDSFYLPLSYFMLLSNA